MEGKVLGLPFAVLFFIFGIAVLVVAPVYYFHVQEMKAIRENRIVTVYKEVTPTVTATPEPTVSISPTKATSRVTVKPASTSGLLK